MIKIEMKLHKKKKKNQQISKQTNIELQIHFMDLKFHFLKTRD